MRPPSEQSSSFPYWVALGSLTFALLLFFSNTVPALREQQGLQEVEQQLGDLRQRYELAIQEAALGAGATNEFDLQSLLVAIDEQGYTPAELCIAYPQPAQSPEDGGGN